MRDRRNTQLMLVPEILAEAGASNEFEGNSRSDIPTLIATHGPRGDRCVVAIDAVAPCTGRVGFNGCVEISQEAFLIAESKAFLIEAMTTRDDRLALFSHAVLRYMVEAGH